ncbi:phospholipid:lipid A palmitoyltransferase [Salmonella enterica subsp. arizonae]|nr:phospholipid:lipid A palmitoyltransferase [Salmonella enterica subsp. arizonae]
MICMFPPLPGMLGLPTIKRKRIAITSDRGALVLVQSRWDDKGNWHGLYMMAFKDSFNKWEPIGGYGWEKTWRPLEDDHFRLGLGFTAGVTARDNWHYIPVPVLLPLASIGYGSATFQMTYIPGSYNNGNVYFAWMRFQF